MGCESCGTIINGKPAGCKSNGSCATGGCNKLNTFDWLADLPVFGDGGFDVVEVSFNNGSRKDFFRKRPGIAVDTGDWIVVDAQFGHDVGKITLSGELVRLQMRKKKVKDNDRISLIQRRATEKDLERYQEAKANEKEMLVTARAIARQLELDMKIGQVEVQGDGKKVTFYYTADGRVDFRELIKAYAREFKKKIEMRQIGARQEAGKIGGLGSCGRELCCSTWLSDFKSVSTSAARYQNLAINQAKLSGQCGRLKCCLNYELDTYMDALAAFPKKADVLKTQEGEAYLQKTDIFKQLMYYSYRGKMKYHKLTIEEVNEVLALNAKGEMPENLILKEEPEPVLEKTLDFGNTDGVISLEQLERREKQKRNQRRKKRKGQQQRQGQGNKPQDTHNTGSKPEGNNAAKDPGKRRRRPPRGNRDNNTQPPKDN